MLDDLRQLVRRGLIRGRFVPFSSWAEHKDAVLVVDRDVSEARAAHLREIVVTVGEDAGIMIGALGNELTGRPAGSRPNWSVALQEG